MGAREVTPYRCAGCGKPAVGRIKPCDCPTRVGFRDGEPSVWLYDNKADAEIASLGLDPDTVATVRSGLTAAGYVILSPDEVRGIRDEALEEAAKEAKIGWVTADYDTVGIVDADKAMALCEHIEIAIHSLKGGRDVT